VFGDEAEGLANNGTRLMSEISGQGGHSLPDFQPRVCANSARKTSRSLFCAYRWTQNDGAGLEPRLCVEMNKASNGWPIKARIVRKPIRQRPHEENERVLLCIRQTQTTNVARVHVGDRLRRRAAGRTFARIMGLALSKLPQCSYQSAGYAAAKIPQSKRSSAAAR
jgi:hypothetical protein